MTDCARTQAFGAFLPSTASEAARAAWPRIARKVHIVENHPNPKKID